MKAVILSVLVAIAVAAVNAENVALENTAFGYHFKTGIPKANKIRAAETAAAAAGNNGQRIVGGSNTDISEVPYQVGLVIRILYILTSVCGGSLISRNHVLTAAHCYHDGLITAQSFTTVFGSNFLFTGGQRLNTNDVTVHSAWDPFRIENDIAVLTVGTVELDNVVQVISLPASPESFVGLTGTASGFGLKQDGGSIGNDQSLDSVNLRIITNEECGVTFGEYVRETNLCTSGEGGRSVCSGDSGGPIVVPSGNGRILVGITSFGAQAGCQLGHPQAFVRVTSFQDWIQSVIA